MSTFLGALIVMSMGLATPAPLAHVPSPADPPEIGMSEGQMHPDFYLPLVGGGHARLSDYRGKKVMLFHFASW